MKVKQQNKYLFGRTVKAYDLTNDEYHEYVLPTKEDFFKNYDETLGIQYDDIEEKEVQGQVPLLWERA